MCLCIQALMGLHSAITAMSLLVLLPSVFALLPAASSGQLGAALARTTAWHKALLAHEIARSCFNCTLTHGSDLPDLARFRTPGTLWARLFPQLNPLATAGHTHFVQPGG